MEEKNEKCQRILDAAKREFAKYGYEKASTSRICKNAGVSKGLLFHHFKTKRCLYFEICKNSMEYFSERLHYVDNSDCQSYIDYILKISKLKLKCVSENYEAYEILLDALYKTPLELKEELRIYFDKYIAKSSDLAKSVFAKYSVREGVDHLRAWEVMNGVLEIIERKFMREIVNGGGNEKNYIKSLNDMADEMIKYLDIVFYGIAAK